MFGLEIRHLGISPQWHPVVATFASVHNVLRWVHGNTVSERRKCDIYIACLGTLTRVQIQKELFQGILISIFSRNLRGVNQVPAL